MRDYKENIVYAIQSRDLDHVRERITAEVAIITQDLLHRSQMETEYRLDDSRVTNDAHVGT
jgi:hypothetical protein